jgi:hypothetical protein
MNISTIFAALSLLQKGREVANPEAWKSGQITANVLGGVILAAGAVAKAAGIPLPIDEASSLTIAGGVIALFNVVATAVSSKRAGI